MWFGLWRVNKSSLDSVLEVWLYVLELQLPLMWLLFFICKSKKSSTLHLWWGAQNMAELVLQTTGWFSNINLLMTSDIKYNDGRQDLRVSIFSVLASPGYFLKFKHDIHFFLSMRDEVKKDIRAEKKWLKSKVLKVCSYFNRWIVSSY